MKTKGRFGRLKIPIIFPARNPFMKKQIVPTLLLTVVLTACTNADPKVMARELCDCVQSKEQVSTKAKKIILKAARASDFETAIEEELAAIEDEVILEEVRNDIQTVALAFDNKKVKDCAAEVDKKHRVSKRDEKQVQQKLVEEMENLDDCAVFAAVVRIGLREQENEKTTAEE